MYSRVGKIALVAFALLPTVRAADTVFHSARLSRLDSNQEPRIDLTLSDSSCLVREPKATPIEIRYSSIQKITYQYSRHRRTASGLVVAGLSPLAGIIVMSSKTKSHWLVFDYDQNGESKSLVLRLDKSDYKEILDTLEAKSGKHVDSSGSKTVALDPTDGSQDVDGVVPASTDKVAAALKPAMEMYGCKVRKDQPTLVECKLNPGSSERTGIGGEVVTATLDSQGQETHIRIVTSRSPTRRRNWSTPIYNQLLASLGLNP
jgi:hypothetical protein